MKVFAAGLATETNTFCPRLTTKKNFRDEYWKVGGEHGDIPHAWAVPLTVFEEKCKKNGWDYIESLFAAAQPAGVVAKKDYEEMRDIILTDLSKEIPVDVVLLNLHGAMVAQDYDDCEGDILSKVRSIVGKDVLIGALLDPHANLTKQMLDNADVLVCYKEYPHTDVKKSAEDLFLLIENAHNKKTRPCMVAFDCHVINSYPTTIEPMKTYLENLRSVEKQEDVLSISVVHGFPWSDVEDVGSKIIVITNNNFKKGIELAKDLGMKLFDIRGQTMPKFYSIDEALHLASQSTSYPVVLADFADNPGGGAAGDSTFILQRLIELNIQNAALGVLWDPMAVEYAASAGIGTKLDLRIGGKTGPQSGNPLDLTVEVTAIDPNLTVNFGGGVANHGRAVALRAGNIDIVLTTLRLQVYSTECFTKMGIELKNKTLIVVKSSEHFRSSFSQISKNIISVSTSGTLCPEFSSIHYTKIKRALWPLDKSFRLEDISGCDEERKCKK